MGRTAWRIVKARFVRTAFDGAGARRFGGRWNSKGVSVVYTAESQALAVLEMLIHLEAGDLLTHYRLIPVTFDETYLTTLNPKTLPPHWRRPSAPTVTRRIGDAWIASGESAVLQVPSVIVPGESNYLLNPAHPDFAKLVIGRPEPFRFDRRLK